MRREEGVTNGPESKAQVIGSWATKTKLFFVFVFVLDTEFREIL